MHISNSSRMITIATAPVHFSKQIPRTTLTPRLFSVVVSLNLGLGSKPRKGGSLFRLVWADDSGDMDSLRKFRTCYFLNRPINGQEVEVDNINQANYAASPGAKLQPEHLVVMVNGLAGSAKDWRYAAEQFVKRLPDKVIVHRSKVNSSRMTFDGVDCMGDRLAEEVVTIVNRFPGLRKISFIAHSLGGLVARYAIGRLYRLSPRMETAAKIESFSSREADNSEQHLEQCYEARIVGLEPINFITFATPHLGSIGHKQFPLLCGLAFLEKRASQTAHYFAGKSGKHLFLTDENDGKPPLLLQMVKDSDDIKFMSALRAFRRRVAYANANFDQIVGWRTSSIRRLHELPESNLLIKDKKYPHILHVDQGSAEGITNEESSTVGTGVIDLEEEMIKGLTQVPWERVDVSFSRSAIRYVAHATIQVSSYWLNSDGVDVVGHMIDNFVT